MMPDLAAISGAATGLQAAGQILKSLLGLKIDAEIQSKIIELQGVISTTQGDTLAAQSEQFALLQRVRELETEVAKARAWETEKERYELKEFPTGVFAYALKPKAAGREPPHRICPNCYQEAHRSILQVIRKEHSGELVECHRCTKTFLLSEFHEPPINYDRGGWV